MIDINHIKRDWVGVGVGVHRAIAVVIAFCNDRIRIAL
jgi:hypothetical protein